MYMQIRLPLACLLIMLYCFWYYTRKRRLPTLASRLFTALCGVTILNLIAATVTEYTVNNRDAVPSLLNDVWHVIFIVSITLWCMLMLLYVLLLIERDGGGSQRSSKIALSVVCGCVIVLELFLPIEYIDTAYGSYSLGPKAYALYISVAYVLVLLPYKALRYRRVLGKASSNVLVASAIVYIVVAVIQMLFPHILLSSLAATMIILGLMVNMEDNNLYISHETGIYNKFAFQKIAQEKLNNHHPLATDVYFLRGTESAVTEAITAADKRIASLDHNLICCRVLHNAIAVVPKSGWRRGHTLPQSASELDLSDLGVRYNCECFKFEPGTVYPQVEGTIRNAGKIIEDRELKIDELTRLVRRDTFIEQVEGRIERAEGFTLLMIDLDDFKDINDSYGHGIGDEVLREVSFVFKDVIRATDIACRMGGDEFSIMLSGAPSPEHVRTIVDRIMKGVAKLDVLPEGSIQGVRVSVGACEYHPQDGACDFKTLYNHADEAMYSVKRRGKSDLLFYS